MRSHSNLVWISHERVDEQWIDCFFVRWNWNALAMACWFMWAIRLSYGMHDALLGCKWVMICCGIVWSDLGVVIDMGQTLHCVCIG